MAGISYQTYHFIGNALTEEQFLELKKLFQLDRNAVAEKYKVRYLPEIWAEFKIQTIVSAALLSLAVILNYFLPAGSTEWLAIIVVILYLAAFLQFVSMFISILSFLSYLANKRHYGTLHLYLLEISPDFRSYLDEYLKYAR